VRRLLLPLLIAVVAAALSAVLGALTAAPAWAHTRLVSSVPAAGQPAVAPDEVVLVFSDPVQAGLSALSVRGPDGEEQVDGSPTAGADEVSVSQALRAPLRPGTWTVAYRVLAADGHPVTGSFEVTTVAPAETAAPAETPPPSAAPAPSGASPLPTTPTPTATTAALSPAADERDNGGLPLLPLVVGGLVVAGLGGLLVRRLGGTAPRS
jgi:copper resistance protein C